MDIEQKQLIVEILQELAKKGVSFIWNHSGNISNDCSILRNKIKEYAQKFEIDEPYFEWDIYINEE